MKSDKRIYVRVSGDAYDQLDDKRHASNRISWQDLLENLLMAWLRGDGASMPTPQPVSDGDLPPLAVMCPSEAHRDVVLDLLPILNRPEAVNFIAAFRALVDVERTKQRKGKEKF